MRVRSLTAVWFGPSFFATAMRPRRTRHRPSGKPQPAGGCPDKCAGGWRASRPARNKS